MIKVFQYAFLDLLRNRWSWAYAMFFMLSTVGLVFLGGSGSKAVVSLMNGVILLVPLITLVYGLMYMYQVRDYVEILLAQPISRRAIFTGYFLGLALALSLCVVVGLAVPMLVMDASALLSPAWAVLLLLAVLLSVIFAALACNLVLRFDNRLRGFGMGLFWWLFLAVLYDGLILVALVLFEAYPMEQPALILTLLNPIDMGRVLLIFQLDYSALMGFTGAVFEKFFGSSFGSVVIGMSYLLWVGVPVLLLRWRAGGKDF